MLLLNEEHVIGALSQQLAALAERRYGKRRPRSSASAKAVCARSS
jgi:hypothetical protein